jgi:putative heme iron utilization protein
MSANQERSFAAEAARLLAAARTGTLATAPAGVPYAALVTPALATDGGLLLLLSDLSAHTRHLRENPSCALLVVGQPPDGEANPQTAPRLLLTCTAAISTAAADRETYLAAHPYAELYAGFGDFNVWRLRATAAHYVGGFAAAAGLDIAALHHEIYRMSGNGYG